MPDLPDYERCTYTTPAGRRCRKGRMTDAVTLCYYRFEAEKQAANPAAGEQRRADRAEITRRLLPNRDGLNSAGEVRRFLSRVTRSVADGSLEPRVGNSLGYLGQILLTTIAQRNLEGAAEAKANEHPIFGQHLDSINELIQSLDQALAEEVGSFPDASQSAPATSPSTDDVQSAPSESSESAEAAGGSS